MRQLTRLRTFLAAIIMLLVVPFCYADKTATPQTLPLDELRALSEAYYRIKSAYVRNIDDSALIRAAIRGMVAELDRHSRYLPPEEFARFNVDNEGEYAGIGLTFSDHKYGIEIAEVLNNSPAQRAGLEAGMLVTHIDGQSLKFMPADTAYQRLKGEVGSSVMLTVAAAKFAQPREFKLVREIILLESVRSQLLPEQTGYIAISQFTLHSYDEFLNAVTRLSQEKPLSHLIIDLRDNPGGVMEVALDLADLFIADGKLLVSAGRAEDANQVYYAEKDAPLKKLKLLVMINGGSASASEILAAALQDHHQAIIFGENSYGKGSIQSIYRLNESAGMKLTTAEYFSPLGKPIQDVGIKPDIDYQQRAEENTHNVTLLDDPQLLQAYHLLTNRLHH